MTYKILLMHYPCFFLPSPYIQEVFPKNINNPPRKKCNEASKTSTETISAKLCFISNN